MNRFKSLSFLLIALAIVGAPLVVIAGLNPALPGLAIGNYATIKTIGNNGFSVLCVDCHGRNPVSGAGIANGSHFVSISPDASGAANLTHSGGGWGTAGTDSQAGFRTGGEYFKIDAWPASGLYAGGFSKYGNIANDNSYSTGSAGNHTGVVDNTTRTNYTTREIICESCHNILVNTAGGNNLLGPGPVQTVAAAEDMSVTAPNLCVGCHGDMYTVSTANDNVGGTHQTKYNSVRNLNEVAGSGRKGVNSIHTIQGGVYANNHHVTTGDTASSATVGAGITWRDTFAIDVAMSPVGNGVRAGAQMPMQATWVDGKSKSPVAVSCLNCHAAGHNGNQFTGASILRDGSNLKAAAPATGVSRLGESTRAWLDFTDVAYCNDCHTLAGQR
jgi:predicted heme/steroid binding protein